MKNENELSLIDDGEVMELTDEDFARMRPLREAMPPEFVDMVLSHQAKMEKQGLMAPRTRGKQKQPTKQSVTIRLSREVIDAFKATGQGWQTRINEVLLKHIHTSM